MSPPPAVVTFNIMLSIRALLDPVFLIVRSKLVTLLVAVIVQLFWLPEIVIPVVVEVSAKVVLLDKKSNVNLANPAKPSLLTLNLCPVDPLWENSAHPKSEGAG